MLWLYLFWTRYPDSQEDPAAEDRKDNEAVSACAEWTPMLLIRELRVVSCMTPESESRILQLIKLKHTHNGKDIQGSCLNRLPTDLQLAFNYQTLCRLDIIAALGKVRTTSLIFAY